MFARLKDYWEDLKRGEPGSRFQDQHDKERSEQRSSVGRVLRIIAGFLLIPIGVFFLAVPGPGLLVIALGAVMIATELRVVAQALDAIELRVRRITRKSA